MKRKICVVVTARASYCRVKTMLQAIQVHPMLTLQLVVTGSSLLDKYGGLIHLVVQDGFDNVIRLSNLLDNENATAAAKTTGLGTIELAAVFENVMPDIVVTVADRYETMSAAIAASFMNIPLAHVQGGEVTGNIDEKVRHAVSKLADIHFVATEKSRQRLIAMGEVPGKIWQAGCPCIDLASQTDLQLPFDYEHCKITHLSPGERYLIVMHHPVTTENGSVKEQFQSLMDGIEGLQMPAFWFSPNSDFGADRICKEIQLYKAKCTGQQIHFIKNLAPETFLKLVKNCACLIGNSSTGIREGSFLGTPVVNIGSRQHGRERADNVIDVQYNSDAIFTATQHQLRYGVYKSSPIYGAGDAGIRIAALLADVELTISKKMTY